MVWLRSIAAIILGYAVMIGGTIVARSVAPEAEYGGPLGPLLAMGFLTAAGGGLGGTVTAMLAPRWPFLHLLPMAFLIALETTALYLQGRVDGPLWFELMAGASLIAGTFVGAGAWLALKVLGSNHRRAAA